ncbi:hypothetical protein BU17DRAFT_65443 [Hysterangium stoloniferum]|nr:hypothetical protein BU17DRAFT_65443 [Hysterangium stoloniferum]
MLNSALPEELQLKECEATVSAYNMLGGLRYLREQKMKSAIKTYNEAKQYIQQHGARIRNAIAQERTVPQDNASMGPEINVPNRYSSSLGFAVDLRITHSRHYPNPRSEITMSVDDVAAVFADVNIDVSQEGVTSTLNVQRRLPASRMHIFPKGVNTIVKSVPRECELGAGTGKIEVDGASGGVASDTSASKQEDTSPIACNTSQLSKDMEESEPVISISNPSVACVEIIAMDTSLTPSTPVVKTSEPIAVVDSVCTDSGSKGAEAQDPFIENECNAPVKTSPRIQVAPQVASPITTSKGQSSPPTTCLHVPVTETESFPPEGSVERPGMVQMKMDDNGTNGVVAAGEEKLVVEHVRQTQTITSESQCGKDSLPATGSSQSAETPVRSTKTKRSRKERLRAPAKQGKEGKVNAESSEIVKPSSAQEDVKPRSPRQSNPEDRETLPVSIAQPEESTPGALTPLEQKHVDIALGLLAKEDSRYPLNFTRTFLEHMLHRRLPPENSSPSSETTKPVSTGSSAAPQWIDTMTAGEETTTGSGGIVESEVRANSSPGPEKTKPVSTGSSVVRQSIDTLTAGEEAATGSGGIVESEVRAGPRDNAVAPLSPVSLLDTVQAGSTATEAQEGNIASVTCSTNTIYEAPPLDIPTSLASPELLLEVAPPLDIPTSLASPELLLEVAPPLDISTSLASPELLLEVAPPLDIPTSLASPELLLEVAPPLDIPTSLASPELLPEVAPPLDIPTSLALPELLLEVVETTACIGTPSRSEFECDSFSQLATVHVVIDEDIEMLDAYPSDASVEPESAPEDEYVYMDVDPEPLVNHYYDLNPPNHSYVYMDVDPEPLVNHYYDLNPPNHSNPQNQFSPSGSTSSYAPYAAQHSLQTFYPNSNFGCSVNGDPQYSVQYQHPSHSCYPNSHFGYGVNGDPQCLAQYQHPPQSWYPNPHFGHGVNGDPQYLAPYQTQLW